MVMYITMLKPSLVYGFGHTLYYQNIIDAMRGTAEAETDGREGLRSLEVLIATYILLGMENVFWYL